MSTMRNYLIYMKNLFLNANTFNRERETRGFKERNKDSEVDVTTCCLEGKARHNGEKETMWG